MRVLPLLLLLVMASPVAAFGSAPSVTGIDAVPGQTVSFRVLFFPTTDSPAPIALSATVPAGWNATIDPPVLVLGSETATETIAVGNAEIPVSIAWVRVQIPATAALGEYDVSVLAAEQPPPEGLAVSEARAFSFHVTVFAPPPFNPETNGSLPWLPPVGTEGNQTAPFPLPPNEPAFPLLLPAALAAAAVVLMAAWRIYKT